MRSFSCIFLFTFTFMVLRVHDGGTAARHRLEQHHCCCSSLYIDRSTVDRCNVYIQGFLSSRIPANFSQPLILCRVCVCCLWYLKPRSCVACNCCIPTRYHLIITPTSPAKRSSACIPGIWCASIDERDSYLIDTFVCGHRLLLLVG